MLDIKKIVFAFIVVAFVILLKWQFMQPGLKAWLWLLEPAVFIFRLFTNSLVTFDAELGFMAANQGFIIDKSCAGLNFLLILLSLTSFFILKQNKNPFLYTLIMILNYPLAFIINGLRMVFVYYGFLYFGVSSFIHMFLSIMIFFSFLLFYSNFISQFLKGKPNAAESSH